VVSRACPSDHAHAGVRAWLPAARCLSWWRSSGAERHDAAVAELDTLNAELVSVGVDGALAQHAGELADERALRGYDAVHLASALALGAGETIVVTWDRDLSNTAVGAGLAVAPAL
jgi:predicted nucleic acid-binding protein